MQTAMVEIICQAIFLISSELTKQNAGTGELFFKHPNKTKKFVYSSILVKMFRYCRDLYAEVVWK